mgnify:CR=1 FL=1
MVWQAVFMQSRFTPVGDPSIWDDAPPVPPIAADTEWVAANFRAWQVRFPITQAFFAFEPATLVEPDDPTASQIGAWAQPANAPIWPTEYVYLLPYAFFQGNPSDFVEPAAAADTTGHRIVYPTRFDTGRKGTTLFQPGQATERFQRDRRPSPFDDGGY